ncbi:MAG: tyrosine-protein phosphatase [Pseudomonadales bacterium]|jgi:protein-tyrosine phosphatase|nr:tyrosine-protein phosphatase [Pseudomonadales bacterium]MCP5320206.1 tyrosine-protein phosphatase [Pseudomonadales bacterium]MCP5337753.1 tyrosine-protein phosphatase [Pseudomonadales bacterium]
MSRSVTKPLACNAAANNTVQYIGVAMLLFATVLAGACARKPEPPPLSEQQVAFAGAPNFRDLGGYLTRDGRRLRTGMLYRSGSLAHLTDADLERLATLKLHTVYDFRTPAEVGPAPDRLPPDSGIERVALPIGDPGVDVEALRKRIYAGDIEGLQLAGSYANLVLDKSDIYRAWFEDLLDTRRIPGVFHCTAGKDRTGVGAALFLYALGVPRETVLQDYLASNYYLHDSIEGTVWKARLASRFKVDGDRLRALLGVNEGLLENAFEAIEARYGSLDHYLEQALGLDAEKRERLQALYLE